MHHRGPEILLDDEPRFAGGAEISLAYAHLSLVFDKAIRAFSLTCDDEDGEAVRLILKPAELEQIAREFLVAREWSRKAGIKWETPPHLHTSGSNTLHDADPA